jgi:hypothetical protein
MSGQPESKSRTTNLPESSNIASHVARDAPVYKAAQSVCHRHVYTETGVPKCGGGFQIKLL